MASVVAINSDSCFQTFGMVHGGRQVAWGGLTISNLELGLHITFTAEFEHWAFDSLSTVISGSHYMGSILLSNFFCLTASSRSVANCLIPPR